MAPVDVVQALMRRRAEDGRAAARALCIAIAAGDDALADELIDAGAPLNSAADPALVAAAAAGDAPRVARLLARGARTGLVPAIAVAHKCENAEAARVLLEALCETGVALSSYHASVAAEFGCIVALERFLAAPIKQERASELLGTAIMRGRADAVRLLIARGADAFARHIGETLRHAARLGHAGAIRAVLEARMGTPMRPEGMEQYRATARSIAHAEADGGGGTRVLRMLLEIGLVAPGFGVLLAVRAGDTELARELAGRAPPRVALPAAIAAFDANEARTALERALDDGEAADDDPDGMVETILAELVKRDDAALFDALLPRDAPRVVPSAELINRSLDDAVRLNKAAAVRALVARGADPYAVKTATIAQAVREKSTLIETLFG